MTNILGITIATPGYYELAYEAARRFRQFTGLDVIILTADRPDSYDLKFSILQAAGDRTAVFFDSDLWLVAPLDLASFYNTSSIWAVRDASRQALDSFCLPDALTLGFPPDNYVNTGFFVCNGRLSQHRAALDDAAAMLAAKKAGHPDYALVKDVTEQSILNAAWHRSGVPIEYLPDAYNFWPRALERGFYDKLPTRPYCVHAADVPVHLKWDYLAHHASLFDHALYKALAHALPPFLALRPIG